MKTLIFPSEFRDNRGGVPQSTISIVKGLAQYPEFRVVIVCPKESEMATTLFKDNIVVLTTKSSSWIISKHSPLGTIKTVLDLYVTIKCYITKDTWIVSNQPSTSSLISMMPCRHVKEVYINRGGDFCDKGIASRIIKYKLKKHKIDFAVGISKKQTDLLQSCGMIKERMQLIHNGLDLPNVKYKYIPLCKDNLRISTIGFISDLKNQMEGVRLVKLLHDKGINAVLNIYGDPDGDSDYQDRLTSLINELEVRQYINYYGFVTGEDLFRDTDILISFSKSEGFGRSLVEGMLRFKPIIAWRGAGGPIDITADGRYGALVDNNDAHDYYVEIRKLIDDKEFNHKRVKDAYQYALRNFTVDCMVGKYVVLFRKICK